MHRIGGQAGEQGGDEAVKLGDVFDGHWGKSRGREGKAPKKGATFELYGITKRNLQPPAYTTTGLPAVSGLVLRQLAGKPGAARAVERLWDSLKAANYGRDEVRRRVIDPASPCTRR